MRSRNLLRFAALAGGIIVAVSISGCSIAGYGAGAAIDRSLPDQKHIDGWKIGAVEPYRDIITHLRDGSSIEGEYIGLVELPDSQYAASSSQFEESGNGLPILASIGDTVRILTENQSEIEHVFEGFTYKYDKTARKKKESLGAEYQFVTGKPLDGGKARLISINDVIRMELSDGAVMEGDYIRKLSSEGMIPLKKAAALSTRFGGTRYYPVNAISTVETDRVKNARIAGLIVGVIVDVVAVMLLAPQLSYWEM